MSICRGFFSAYLEEVLHSLYGSLDGITAVRIAWTRCHPDESLFRILCSSNMDFRSAIVVFDPLWFNYRTSGNLL